MTQGAIDQIREVLRFYADDANWELDMWSISKESSVCQDNGDKARAALEALDGQMEAVESENAALRKALRDVVRACGGHADEDVSVGFLGMVVKEVQALREAYLELRNGYAESMWRD